MQRLPLSSLPETCHYSESFEDVATIDEEDGHTITLQPNNSINGGHALSRGPPQLFRQRGINEYTVEVHEMDHTQDIDINNEESSFV